MIRSAVIRTFAGVVGIAVIAGCGSSNSPSSQSLTDFTTGLTSSDGVVAASSSRGAAPSASGGPAVTATTSGTSTSSSVINGGSTIVHLRAAQSFNQVFMSVIDDPLDGFFTLTLPAATQDTFVIVQLARTIPHSTFQTVFSVKTPGGAVGSSASIANTVNTAASIGQVQVNLSWDTLADMDLHVIEPNGHEIYWADQGPSTTGGLQDLDANAFCTLNRGVNNENIRWTSNAPNGTYIVRVDEFDNCSSGTTNTVVTINNGTSSNTFGGSFTASQADSGVAGSGKTITSFVHSGSSVTTEQAPAAPQALSPEVLAKRARALGQGR